MSRTTSNKVFYFSLTTDFLENEQKLKGDSNNSEKKYQYLKSLDYQLRVNDKQLEMLSMERVKLQMREDQLQSSSYLAHIKDEIERTQREVQSVKAVNYRLEVE